jgi:hypothetical protein
MPDEYNVANRVTIAARAQACLDHVRSVKWGEAVASYQVDDGDLRIWVTISVKSLGPAHKPPAETDLP